MSEEENLEQQFVQILGEDGSIIKCEVYDIIDFEEKTYVMLLPLSEDEGDDDAEVIVMEYIEEGEDCYFQNIDDEKEFNRVCEYIQSLEKEDFDEE